jgi:hypothetical protein
MIWYTLIIGKHTNRKGEEMITRTITPKVKRHINKELHSIGTYHSSIPLDSIFSILAMNQIVPISEDGTEWAGFLCGENSFCYFDMAWISVLTQEPLVKVKNSVLSLSWYRMSSNRYEILAYVT